MSNRKHIGVFRQLPLDSTEEEREIALYKTAKSAKIIQDFYRRQAGHVWDVEVRPYVMLGEQSTHPTTYANDDVENYINSNDMEGFFPNYIHVIGGYSSGFCGQASLGLNRSVRYINYACKEKTDIHEIGHALGLRHSQMLKDGNILEYGGDDSIMSTTPLITGFNSVERVRLGLETDREILEVTDTQRVYIAPLEMNPLGMHDYEHQNIVINKNGKTFHISLRKVLGNHYATGGESEDTLFIHERIDDGHSRRYWPDLRPQESVYLADIDVTVKYHSYENECAKVDLLFGGDTEVDQSVQAKEGLPPAPEGTTLEEVHRGSYYDKAVTGEGLNLTCKDGLAVVYYYTYNHKEVSRRFYFAVGTLEELKNGTPLLTTTGGTWDSPWTRQEFEVGECQLYFDEEGNGVFNYITEELGRQTLQVTRPYVPAEHSSNGIYYNDNRSGEGFELTFYDDVCTVYWYCYGPRPGGYPRYDGIQDQRWYLCVGNKVAANMYELEVHEGENNVWMGLRDDPNMSQVGTMLMEIVDENNLQIYYDITQGSGSTKVKRLL